VLIVNASPLVFLGNAGLLPLLQTIDSEVVVAQSAFDEVTKSQHSDSAKIAVQNANWLTCKRCPAIPAAVIAWDLGPGESEVLALGLQQTMAVTLVLDDLAARRCALSLGLKVMGTLGVVVLAHRLGAVDDPAQVIEQLRSGGMWLSDTVVKQVRDLASLR
jgi:predicted nucleic acid-binding protein